MNEETVFTETDDVNGDTYLDVWTNTGSDLHILIINVDTDERQQVYLRNGEELAKAILRKAWL
jgi:hypothetical protein